MQTFLALLERWISRLAIAANVAGTLVVLVLVAVVNYDVIARGFFSKPFMGAVEVVQFSLVFIVFLQLPDVVRVDRLTRSDGFLVIARSRWPSVATTAQRFIDALSFLFMLAITYAMWPEFLEMWETKDYFGVPGVFTAPWWPIKLAIFLSALLCSLIFLMRVFRPTPPATKQAPPTGEKTEAEISQPGSNQS